MSIDIAAVKAAAESEVQKELVDAAKIKIKVKLTAIASAKKVVANLENELEVLLKDVAAS